MEEGKEELEEIKNNLTIEQIEGLLYSLGGEPYREKNNIISRTICHNKDCEGKHKLYYYSNTHLFRCFTECVENTFDIFELIKKIKNLNGDEEWNLYNSVNFIKNYFGIETQSNYNAFDMKIKDWEILNRYTKEKDKKEEKRVELKIYDKSILEHMPHPRIIGWEKEGISREVMNECGICYDPVNQGIIIPHFDINNNLIGIRERTLIKEEEENGKYKPAYINNQLYNHPLGFNLFNLNNSKNNIKKIGKAIIFEGEKSSFLFRSYFGKENDISVAVCGSSLTQYQVDLLLKLDVKEIAIAFDRQFKELGDDEHKRWVKKLKEIHKKYSNKCQISFIFDLKNRLGYKDSPIDNGKETFIEMYKERIIL